MWGIHVHNITKKANPLNRKSELIFKNFNLTVRETETVGIFGPNGCGKTTLLNMISGITKPDSGEILIFGERPGKKHVGYIFQDFRQSLFPWLTVKDNIVFPLSLRKIKKKDIHEKLEHIKETVNIPVDLDKYPYQLSGGQQQYVSILRGLISNPDVMLFDEPFSALDYSNSLWLMEKILNILETIKIPTILVAHDINHLKYLTERIYFLSNKPTRIMMEKNMHLEEIRGKYILDDADDKKDVLLKCI